MHSTTGPPGAPREREGRGDETSANAQQQLGDTTSFHQNTAYQATSAQSVNWWDIHQFVAPVLAQAGSWPMAGTPAWCALADDDPAKLAALYSIAENCALHIETAQQAEAQASQAISAAVDWSVIARQVRERQDWLAAHPWARRVTS